MAGLVQECVDYIDDFELEDDNVLFVLANAQTHDEEVMSNS